MVPLDYSNKTELSKMIFFDFDINVGLKLKRCERFLFLQLVDLRSPPTVGIKRWSRKGKSERSHSWTVQLGLSVEIGQSRMKYESYYMTVLILKKDTG